MKWITKNKIDFICCTFIVLIYYINKRFLIKNCEGVIGYFFKCYLNDLIAPIWILALSSIILKQFGYELKKLWIIILIGLFSGLIWEFIVPLIKTTSVTDPYDLCCYIIGAIIYCGIKNIINYR